MKVRLIGAGVLAAASVWSVSPAAAQSAADAKVVDPDEKICENITLVGSRLAVKRVCATRAQWDEKKRQDRSWIEKGQREVCVVSKSGGGSPVC